IAEPPLLAVMQGGDYRARFQFIHIFYDRRYSKTLVPIHLLQATSERPICEFAATIPKIRGGSCPPWGAWDKVSCLEFNKEASLKPRVLVALLFAATLTAGTAAAQPAPFNQIGVTMGHWHIVSKDV